MDKSTKLDMEAAGCLGSIPSRSGMSFVANRLLIEKVAAGGKMVIIDKGQSYETFQAEINPLEHERIQRILRVGRKRNDGPVAQPKQTVPYYRQFDKRKF